jgi:predicted SAM-dependent methyltransferase
VSLKSVPKGSEVADLPSADASGIIVPSLPSPPPPIEELPVLLHRLHGHPAPLFSRDERGGLRRQAKRALNFVLRFVGRSQQVFNRDLLEGVTLLMAEVRSLRRWGESLAGTPNDRPIDPILQELATLQRRVEHLQDWLATGLVDAQRKRLERLEQLDTALADLGRRVDALATQDVALLREFREGFAGYADWITVLQRKYQGVSLEARELTDRAATVPEPRIVDPEAYARRLAEMGSTIRVNVGCGEKPIDGYVNVDLRALPGVDVIADAHRLPFDPGTLDEVASEHLVEHFREHHARSRLLPYWKSLVRSGGRVRIVCPNWAAMLERLHDGRMTLHEFKLVTFGWQDYENDDHFAMYTPETLRELLADVGFSRVEVVVTDRMNGMCPEMELVAHP